MNQGKNNIISEFYLVNTNKQWLIKNFEFIQAFFAGAEWLHMKHCIVRPPNVYHVLCPGRFQIYWAALDIEITFEGKLRKHVEASNYFNSKGINSIDEDMLWPEAWKVKVEIKDLTPNNFNLYAEYYQRGFKAYEIKSLENYIGVTDAITELANYIKVFADDIKNSAGDTINNIKNAATKLKNSVTDTFTSITGQKTSAEKLADIEAAWIAVRNTDDPSKNEKYEAYKNALRDQIIQERKSAGLSTSDAEINEALQEKLGGETTSQKTIRERRQAEERRAAYEQEANSIRTTNVVLKNARTDSTWNAWNIIIHELLICFTKKKKLIIFKI
jgi:hypothetical protein